MRGLMIVAVPVAGLLTACSSTPPPIALPAPSPTTPAQRTVVPVPTSLQVFPDQPPMVHYGTVEHAEIGVAYEYHLYVHCGVRRATFAGREWLAEPRSGPEPPKDLSTQYTVGSMTLLAPDRARFEWPGGSADFSPLTGPDQLCR